MAEYSGQITLIKIRDADSVVGIAFVETYYTITNSSDMPIDDKLYDLVFSENKLSFSKDSGAEFYLEDNILLAKSGGNEIKLVLEDSAIVGAGVKWTTTIPELHPGMYLWSKTITTYTDNSTHIAYNVSRIGEDGQQGEKGDPGDTYKIRTNQTEILKFVDRNGETSFSPQSLTISIYKSDPSLESGEQQLDKQLSLNGLKLSVYNRNGGSWVNMPSSLREKIVVLEGLNIRINLDVNILQTDTNDFSEIFMNNETVLEISYLHQTEDGQKIHLTSHIDVRYGMSKDMASLSVNANGIVAAMQDSKMIFDGSGLTVKNGAFRIVNEKDENQLYADQEGNLVLKGKVFATGGKFTGELEAATGSFKGELKAATGSFSGELTAKSGKIGGFTIEENRLVSTALNDEEAPFIILDGTNGAIEAENITLGTGAVIKEYIQVGNYAQIKRPIYTGDSFISVTEPGNENHEILCLKNNGVMNIGYEDNMIIIDGKNGIISSQNFNEGLGWKISNTESIFNDVVVRGSIRASVLEYGETQAIGGALLVRPSSRIKDYKVEQDPDNEEEYITTLTLESTSGFQVGDYCRIDDGFTKRFYVVLSLSDNKIVVKGNTNNVHGFPIVSFGHTDEKGNRAVGIGINGSIDNTLVASQAITVFDFNENNQSVIPRIILGKLPSGDVTYGSLGGTYGLYAENVLLKGALVTQTRDQSGNKLIYSGISTLFANDAPNSGNSLAGTNFTNPGEILIWAGAPGDSKQEIEQANFFVDRNGNLFAGSGYFKGTIITDATISASEIKTAVLTGDGNSPALIIKDAATGIHFITNENGVDKTIFEVSKDKVSINAPMFELNNDFRIGETGGLIVPNLYIIGKNTGVTIDAEDSNISSLMFSKSRISFTDNFDKTTQTGLEKSFIEFSNGMEFFSESKKMLTINSSKVQVDSVLALRGVVEYGETMEYRPIMQGNILIGYDLYID